MTNYNEKSANAALGNYGTSVTYVSGVPFISKRIDLNNLEYVLLSANGIG